MTIDLSNLSFDDDTPRPARDDLCVDDEPAGEKPADTSGKPFPTEAYAMLADGNRLELAISYRGVQAEGFPVPHAKRIYRLLFEGDWARLIDQITAIHCNNFVNDIAIELKADTPEGDDLVYERVRHIAFRGSVPRARKS